MMSEHLCRIDICDIDLTDQRYKISFSNDNIVSLARSINEIGLIHPPMVRPLNNHYIIVSGFNRIKASIHNKEDTIFAYTTKSDADGYQCLLKSITALSFKRQLSQAELIKSIKSLNKFLDTKQIAEKSAAIFNIELNVRFIKDLLNISNLPEPALNLIHQGKISLKAARRMQLFQEKTIKSFLKIFSKIKASNNKQLEIIQYIVEISKRDSINIEIFFQNQEIQEIILNENREPLLKTKLLREYLFKLRFPAFSK
ncbi:MAG: ParB/RepB/Spo0J family partition protein, partial [Thermodesulfobacteriota bacterium]